MVRIDSGLDAMLRTRAARSLVGAVHMGEPAAVLTGRRQDSTTTSGHTAWTTPRTSSARPACPAPVTSSAPNHASKASSTATAPAHTAGRRAHGTDGPRRQAPPGQAASATKPTDAQVACGSEPPPGGCGFTATSMPAADPVTRISRPTAPAWPKRQPGDHVTAADQQERQRHHPPVGGVRSGQRADRIGHRVEGRRLRAGGSRPSADQHQRGCSRGDHAPPRHVRHDGRRRQSPPGRIVAKVPPQGPLGADLAGAGDSPLRPAANPAIWPGRAARCNRRHGPASARTTATSGRTGPAPVATART